MGLSCWTRSQQLLCSNYALIWLCFCVYVKQRKIKEAIIISKTNQNLMTSTSATDFLQKTPCNTACETALQRKTQWRIHSTCCYLWPSRTHRIQSGTRVQPLPRWAWWKPPQCLSPLRRWPLWPCYQLSSASPSSFGSSAWAGPQCLQLLLKQQGMVVALYYCDTYNYNIQDGHSISDIFRGQIVISDVTLVRQQNPCHKWDLQGHI